MCKTLRMKKKKKKLSACLQLHGSINVVLTLGNRQFALSLSLPEREREREKIGSGHHIRGQNGRLISHDRTRGPRLMKVIKFFCISKSPPPPPPPRAWWMFCPISYESGSTREGRIGGGEEGKGVREWRGERGQNRREGEWKISPSRGSARWFLRRSLAIVSSPRATTIWLPSQTRCIDAPVTLLRELIWFIIYGQTTRERERENDTKIFQRDRSTGKVKGHISQGTRILRDCENLFARRETYGKHIAYVHSLNRFIMTRRIFRRLLRLSNRMTFLCAKDVNLK